MIKVYKKIHELQKQVKGLEIDTQGHGYKYLSGNKLLSVVRPLMDEIGLLLIPEILDVKYERIDYETKNGNKSEMMCYAKLRYTWIDVESGEKMEQLWEQNDMNSWSKGIGGIATYAQRYHLMKTLNLSTAEDDIDARAQEIVDNKLASQEQMREIAFLTKRTKTDSKKLFSHYNIKSFNDVTVKMADEILEVLRKK